MSLKSPKYLEALKLVPENLVPVFDKLLKHYKFASLKHYGREWVSPLVIAELVLLGWENSQDVQQPLDSGNRTKLNKEHIEQNIDHQS